MERMRSRQLSQAEAIVREGAARLAAAGRTVDQVVRVGDPAAEVLAVAREQEADLVVAGLEGAINAKTVTYDLERQMQGAKKLKTSEFGAAIVKNMKTAVHA